MNLPTKFTVARIAMVPLIIVLFCLAPVFEYFYIPMTLLYIITSSTDAIDGHLARKYNMVTDLGKFLDPIADKILVLAGLIIMLCIPYVTPMVGYPIWLTYCGAIGVVIILTREFIIGVLRQMAATKGVVLAADTLGKVKTVMTLIAIPAFMFTPFLVNENIILHYAGAFFFFLGWVTYAIAIVLTVVSGVNYIVKNKQVFLDSNKACDNARAEVASEVATDGEQVDNAEADENARR